MPVPLDVRCMLHGVIHLILRSRQPVFDKNTNTRFALILDTAFSEIVALTWISVHEAHLTGCLS